MPLPTIKVVVYRRVCSDSYSHQGLCQTKWNSLQVFLKRMACTRLQWSWSCVQVNVGAKCEEIPSRQHCYVTFTRMGWTWGHSELDLTVTFDHRTLITWTFVSSEEIPTRESCHITFTRVGRMDRRTTCKHNASGCLLPRRRENVQQTLLLAASRHK